MSILSRTRKILGQAEKAKPTNKGTKAKAKKTEDAQTTAAPMPVQAGRINLRALVTEKSMGRQSTGNVVAFRVAQNTTKGQITAAIRERYKVEPLHVRTLTMKPKRRMRGRTIGRTTNWKKAYVSLPANTSIDLTA